MARQTSRNAATSAVAIQPSTGFDAISPVTKDQSATDTAKVSSAASNPKNQPPSPRSRREARRATVCIARPDAGTATSSSGTGGAVAGSSAAFGALVVSLTSNRTARRRGSVILASPAMVSGRT